MPDRFDVFIPGNPRPKQRPRIGRSGHVYTPRETRQWEATVGWEYKRRRGPRFEGDVSMELEFLYPSARRVDLDNLSKAVLDGLQGVAFEDDSQIVRLTLSKRVDRQLPGVWVRIEEA